MKKLISVVLVFVMLTGCVSANVSVSTKKELEKVSKNSSVSNEEQTNVEKETSSENGTEEPATEATGEVTKEKTDAVTEEGTQVSVEETVEPEEVVEPEVIVEPEINYADIPVLERESDWVYEEIRTETPEHFNINLKYTNYYMPKDYVVVVRNGVNIRQKPTTKSRVIKNLARNRKIEIESLVHGQYFKSADSDLWYKVIWNDNGDIKHGYVYHSIVVRRTFQFQKIADLILSVEDEITNRLPEYLDVAYISNYKNANGRAPRYYGKEEDSFGIARSVAAPAYSTPEVSKDFRYFQDGRVVLVKEMIGKFYRVKVLDEEGDYYVPKKYVSYNKPVEKMTQAIIIDRENQNLVVLEKLDDEWDIISYTYSTTGADSKYRSPTDLGVFKAIERKDKLLYLDDETEELQGYAPHVIRFNGGAYTHGVPINYKITYKETIVQEEVLDEVGNVVQEAVIDKKVQSIKDPGTVEMVHSLGTIPRSHKCVRNITSHALFMHTWVEIGNATVIVIE